MAPVRAESGATARRNNGGGCTRQRKENADTTLASGFRTVAHAMSGLAPRDTLRQATNRGGQRTLVTADSALCRDAGASFHSQQGAAWRAKVRMFRHRNWIHLDNVSIVYGNSYTDTAVGNATDRESTVAANKMHSTCAQQAAGTLSSHLSIYPCLLAYTF